MQNPKRAQLRSILAGASCVVPAPVYDPMSAVLAETTGFEMGMVGGSSVAASVLAAPDVILLTLTELADHVRRMGQASGLPLLIDADHGYGNALNAMRTVAELEAAGAAGLTLEDTTLPLRWQRPVALVAMDEAVDKLHAALAARQDPDFVIVARTSRELAPLDEVVTRARAYAAAGADAIFVHGANTIDDIAAVRAAVDIPLAIGSGSQLTPDRLHALAGLNVRIALPGHQPLHAAMAAMDQAFRALRDPGLYAPPLADLATRERTIRKHQFDTAAARYLGV